MKEAMTVVERVQRMEVEYLGTYLGGPRNEGGHDGGRTCLEDGGGMSRHLLWVERVHRTEVEFLGTYFGESVMKDSMTMLITAPMPPIMVSPAITPAYCGARSAGSGIYPANPPPPYTHRHTHTWLPCNHPGVKGGGGQVSW